MTLEHWYRLPLQINTDAFSHGQVVSKIWLCEELEQYLEAQSNLFILGGWYNVLGFMLLTRRPDHYKTIYNLDMDPTAIKVANKITDAWHRVENITVDANDILTMDPVTDTVINCSVEHFDNNAWFDKLPSGTLCCIQSSNMTDPEEPWLIKQPNPDIQAFMARFPMKETLFLGTKKITYYNCCY